MSAANGIAIQTCLAAFQAANSARDSQIASAYSACVLAKHAAVAQLQSAVPGTALASHSVDDVLKYFDAAAQPTGASAISAAVLSAVVLNV